PARRHHLGARQHGGRLAVLVVAAEVEPLVRDARSREQLGTQLGRGARLPIRLLDREAQLPREIVALLERARQLRVHRRELTLALVDAALQLLHEDRYRSLSRTTHSAPL